MNTKNILPYIFLFLSFFSVNILRGQPPIPSRPSPPKLVNDFANLLSPAEQQRLETDLTHYFDSTSTQIAIVTLADLGDYEIVDWAVEIGKKWGVGTKQKNNGIVIIVALAPRKKTFIATGYGVEGFLPDVVCKRIIEQYINPKFKEGRFYDGLNGGFNGIRAAAKGEFVNENKDKGKGSDDYSFWIFIFIMVAVLIFIIWSQNSGGGNSQYGTRRRGFQGGGGWMIGGFGSGGGGWSGGGGSSDSGSFGGFGGGDFGGGGAGGDW